MLILNVLAYDIITGGTTGTYIKFGNEIKQYVASEIGMQMNVLSSNGSIDNIEKMSLDENIRFALVQHDVISNFKNSRNSKSRRLIRNVKVLLPLYYEEMHFIVRKNSPMKYIKDIEGKK
jgi:TRAP transporter TAXI family solute receptor